MITALIDGDWILYAAGFAGQKTKLVCPALFREREFDNITAMRESAGGEVHEPVYQRFVLDPDAHFYHSAKNMIEGNCNKIAEKFKNNVKARVLIDGDGNFRNQIATIKPYKGQRSVHAKPMKYNDIRAYLVEHQNAEAIHDQETDDEIAILQTMYDEQGERTIIVSVDKDFLQVPGWHFNPNKGFKKVSKQEAKERQYIQCLTGDTVDNIGGCFKMGPAKAAKLLKGHRYTEETMWKLVVRSYELSIEKHGDKYNGLTALEAATENMRLIYLRRKPGEIWTPPEV
jgi:5'-3' exonuclease